jgi:hypothetical protein
VAARQGLEGKSFDRAAEAYSEAVGGRMSGDSLQRITQGWGKQVDRQRRAEAEYASSLGALGESPRERRVAEVAPMEGAANVSTDGAMIFIRGEGWKEVKTTVISAVTVKPAEERAVDPAHPSRREADPVVTLSQHSYQAGLWDADRMALFQYAEGLRRGIDDCPHLSSVNDGAPWIERITEMNFSQAQQIIDWGHAEKRLWAVANEVCGEQTSQAQAWVERQLADLWEGRTTEVVRALDSLSLDASRYSSEVQQAPNYFRARESKMHYDRFRAEGYPIGSGTVESAALTLVHDRMHRPGRGWKSENAQAMLAGLSELHSDRFEHAWQTIPQAVK